MEKWVDVRWYEWYYMVSSLGRVKSLDREIKHWQWWKSLKKWIIMTPTKRPSWYVYVELTKRNIWYSYWVHRLVWQAFHWLDISNTSLYACHKNDIRDDNRAENIFVWTAQDNMVDASIKKRLKWSSTSFKSWEKHPNSKYTDKVRKEIKSLISKWISIKHISNEYWISESLLSHVKAWRRWANI